MADQIITVQVFLTHRFSSSEAKIFGEYLKERALKNKIWLNLCGHFSSPDVQYKYPPDDYLQKGYIPFEITDSENSSEANRILSDILYDENYYIADMSCSGLYDIQSFLEDIIKHEAVSKIIVSIDLAHGYPYPEGFFAKCVIHANEFCAALMTLPNAFAVPGGEFTVVKDGAPIAIFR